MPMPLPRRRTAAPTVDGGPSVGRLLLDARRAYRGGPPAVDARQRARLADLVAFARDRSPYYRHLYAGLPERVEDAAQLPVTRKAALMADFDDVVTDPRVSRSAVDKFIADPARIGEDFLGDYTVAITSGTTGVRGLFLVDQRTLAVASAMAARMVSRWLTPRDLARLVRRRGRVAMVTATGGHFASAAAAARLRRSRRGARMVRLFGVHTPLPDLVEQLNAFRPAVLAPYATTAVLLAGEQQAGRLHIDPALVVLAAEGISLAEQRRIASAFGVTVHSSYAATECPFLSYGCTEGWMHVNSDWVILEPVDAGYRPVPAGQQSHTVLVTNLANRVQPILRYDLGDSVMARPDSCPCGNPLPAIQVRGRTADVLTFPDGDGRSVTITALTLSALLDRMPGVEMAQIAQAAPTALQVRYRCATGADPDVVWRNLAAEIGTLLAAHGLVHVTVERVDEPPRPTAGGKYRLVQPFQPDSAGRAP